VTGPLEAGDGQLNIQQRTMRAQQRTDTQVRKLKTLAALGLTMVGLGAGAASAQAISRDQAAWRDMTYTCIQYTGCSQLGYYSAPLYMASGKCKQYYFKFHTRYYGWMFRTTGAYCAPPYSP
jgi:hypothetical protein